MLFSVRSEDSVKSSMAFKEKKKLGLIDNHPLREKVSKLGTETATVSLFIVIYLSVAGFTINSFLLAFIEHV